MLHGHTNIKHPCLQFNSNPRFQRSNGFRPTQSSAWSSGSATWTTGRRVFSTSALEDSKWHNSLSDDRILPLCQGLSGNAVWTTPKNNVAAKKQKLSQETWPLWPQDGESKFVRNVGILVATDKASHISWRCSQYSRDCVKFGTLYRWSIVEVHRRGTKPFSRRTRFLKHAHKYIITG